MFHVLLNQLVNSIKIVGRTIRAFLLRYVTTAWSRVRRFTSFSRQVARMAPKAMQSAALAGKKPTRREDYVETGQLFISKSFLLLLLLGLVILGLAIYFLVWPFLLSHFFTARMVYTDSRIPEYTGKVIVYYDEKKSIPMYSGKLEEGLLQGKGCEFDSDGVLAYEGTFTDGVREGAGKAFQAGVLVYEGDFSAGTYEGQGTLYDENGMTYEGGFAAGLREGIGTSYRSDGSRIYQGDFVQDQYQGEGSLYEEDGETLKYQGGFLAGAYSGTGKLYEDGVLFYSGELEQGLFQGQGTEYWPNGTVRYAGGFARGKYDQEGKLYAEDGALLYSGEFSEGQYLQGTLYDSETGRKCYVGGFENGSFQGEGVLYPDETQAIEASFAEGRVQGAIQWSKNGLLYYSGEAESPSAGGVPAPDGYGTLFTAGGEAVFQGTFAGGTIDGASLLGMDDEQLYKVLGDSGLTILTKTEKNGFTVQAEELGFTAFLSYQQDAQDPTVYYAYLYQSDWFDLIPWKTQAAYEAWLETADLGDYTCQRVEILPDFAGAVPFEEQLYTRVVYTYSDFIFSLWFREESECFMIEWYSLNALPETAECNSASEASDSRTAALLDQLGLLEISQTQTDTAETQNEAYGTKSITPLLAAAEEQGAFSEVFSALLTYYQDAETLSALSETLTLDRELLAEAQAEAALGQGDDSLQKTLDQEIADLEKQQEKCRLEMEMKTLEVRSATGMELSDYDLQELPLVIDPLKLDVDTLWQDALDDAQAQADALAQQSAQEAAQAEAEAKAQAEALQTQIQEAISQTAAVSDPAPADSEEVEEHSQPSAEEPERSEDRQTTDEMTDGTTENAEEEPSAAADTADPAEALTEPVDSTEPEAPAEPENPEEPEPITGEVDEEALLLELKLKILSLEMAYGDLEQALEAYTSAGQTVTALEKSYGLGIVTRRQVYEAMAEKNTCRAELYGALVAYDEQLMELNLLCGGSLSRDYDWLNGAPALAA